MKLRIAFLALSVIVPSGAALAQEVGGTVPETPLAMEEQGAPLGKDGAGAESKFSAETLRDLGGRLPVSALSRITQQPVVEVTAQARGAADAQIYRSVSPAVVLIATNDGLGSGSLISSSGEILTNWHVVMGYSDVGVCFQAGR